MNTYAKLYHIIRVNDKTGVRVKMTDYPVSHDIGMRIIGKLRVYSRYPELRNVLEPA